MAALQAARCVVRELEPGIGNAIDADTETLLSGIIARDIRAFLDRRGVVLFPAIGFTDDQQVAFTKTLGTYKPEPGSDDGVFKVTMDPAAVGYAYYNQASFFWHNDGTMNDVPILASLMSARRLSPVGGETEFANSYAAYDALSNADKVALENLRAVHSFEAIARHIKSEPSYAELRKWRENPSKVLPAVWARKSGRKSLILGNTAHYLVGLSTEEISDLLVRLRDHATQTRFVYRHAWALGDLVIWDNTSTLHRALPYPFDGGRLMHRTKLEGEQPFFG